MRKNADTSVLQEIEPQIVKSISGTTKKCLKSGTHDRKKNEVCWEFINKNAFI